MQYPYLKKGMQVLGWPNQFELQTNGRNSCLLVRIPARHCLNLFFYRVAVQCIYHVANTTYYYYYQSMPMMTLSNRFLRPAFFPLPPRTRLIALALNIFDVLLPQWHPATDYDYSHLCYVREWVGISFCRTPQIRSKWRDSYLEQQQVCSPSLETRIIV